MAFDANKKAATKAVHIENINTGNMGRLCGAIVKKEEGTKTSKVLKPVRVLTWTKELSFETQKTDKDLG